MTNFMFRLFIMTGDFYGSSRLPGGVRHMIIIRFDSMIIICVLAARITRGSLMFEQSVYSNHLLEAINLSEHSGFVILSILAHYNSSASSYSFQTWSIKLRVPRGMYCPPLDMPLVVSGQLWLENGQAMHCAREEEINLERSLYSPHALQGHMQMNTAARIATLHCSKSTRSLPPSVSLPFCTPGYLKCLLCSVSCSVVLTNNLIRR